MAAMGYLRAEDGVEPVPVFMYDGAAGRANVDPKVSFVTPSERFRDGPQLKVTVSFPLASFLLISVVERLNQGHI
jgi:hypothetical protein